MGFFSSLKAGFSDQTEALRKNKFEGSIKSAPAKKTKQDYEIEKLNKLAKNNDDIFEVLEDDEETKDLERLVKNNGKSYGRQQAEFRKAVLEKFETEDGFFICAHCGRKFKAEDVQADHILPRSSGGSFSIINGQILCNFCNHSKLDSTEDSEEDFQRILKQDARAKEEDKEFLKAINEIIENENF